MAKLRNWRTYWKWLVGGLIGLLVLFAAVPTLWGKVPLKGEAAIKAVILTSKWKKLVNYIIAMSKFETDNLSSNLYLNNHNMFGMGVAQYGRKDGQAPFISGSVRCESDSRDCATYRTDTDSVLDFVNWLEYQQTPTDFGDYYQFLQFMHGEDYFTTSLENYYEGSKKYL